MLARWLQQQWFQRRLTPALWLLSPLLWPLSRMVRAIALRRRRTTRPERLPVPVVVVGNLIVGGAGKTPLTLALASALQARGWQPGIISRGYGRQGPQQNVLCPVAPDATAAEVGDEPLLLARRSRLPVWVGRDRAATGRALLAAQPQVNILLCDDGLQHHRLARDVELVVFDGRGAGNGHCLPLGPLREPMSRIFTVDAVVAHDLATPLPTAGVPVFPMSLRPGRFYRLDDPRQTCTADELAGEPLHALAGIGNPARFFRTLAGLGLTVTAHPFPDHHAYRPADLSFPGDARLLMTEKDAVKCAPLMTGDAAARTWVLPVDAGLPSALMDLIEEKLRGRPIA